MCTGLTRRLKLYREQNEDDVTVLNYFDELEIHPVHISKPPLCTDLYDLVCVCIDVEGDSGPLTVGKVKEILGEPRNYGPSPEEKAEAEKKQKEEEVPIQMTNTVT